MLQPAALSCVLRWRPAAELELVGSLLNRTLEGFDEALIGLHICHGNWSQDESTLLRGSYHPLRQSLERVQVRQLVLEYATERASDLIRFGDKQLGLGVVNPRTEDIETPDEIQKSIDRAVWLYPP